MVLCLSLLFHHLNLIENRGHTKITRSMDKTINVVFPTCLFDFTCFNKIFIYIFIYIYIYIYIYMHTEHIYIYMYNVYIYMYNVYRYRYVHAYIHKHIYI